MVDGSSHVRRTKAGPGQAQNNVEMLMHRAWVTHHHWPSGPITVRNGWRWDKCEPNSEWLNRNSSSWGGARPSPRETICIEPSDLKSVYRI